MTAQLKTEIETYNKLKDELISKSAGKFVLIKGDKLIDTFESQADAINAGYKQFGNVPFLVRLIQEFDTPINFTSKLIAV